MALRSVCTIIEVNLEQRLHPGLTPNPSPKGEGNSKGTIIEVNLEQRLHLGIAQASLTLRSVCTFFDILGIIEAKRDDIYDLTIYDLQFTIYYLLFTIYS